MLKANNSSSNSNIGGGGGSNGGTSSSNTNNNSQHSTNGGLVSNKSGLRNRSHSLLDPLIAKDNRDEFSSQAPSNSPVSSPSSSFINSNGVFNNNLSPSSKRGTMSVLSLKEQVLNNPIFQSTPNISTTSSTTTNTTITTTPSPTTSNTTTPTTLNEKNEKEKENHSSFISKEYHERLSPTKSFLFPNSSVGNGGGNNGFKELKDSKEIFREHHAIFKEKEREKDKEREKQSIVDKENQTKQNENINNNSQINNNNNQNNQNNINENINNNNQINNNNNNQNNNSINHSSNNNNFKKNRKEFWRILEGPPIRLFGNISISFLFLALSMAVAIVVEILNVLFSELVPVSVLIIVVVYLFIHLDSYVYNFTGEWKQKYIFNQSHQLKNSGYSALQTSRSSPDLMELESQEMEDFEFPMSPNDLTIKEKIKLYEGTLNYKHHHRSASGGSNTSATSLPSFPSFISQVGNQNNQNNQNNQSSNNLHQQFSQQQQQQINNSNTNNLQSNQINNNNNQIMNQMNNLEENGNISSSNLFNNQNNSVGSTFYRTRPYDNHRRSLPPNYYNQYLNYNANYKAHLNYPNINSNIQQYHPNDPVFNVDSSNNSPLNGTGLDDLISDGASVTSASSHYSSSNNSSLGGVMGSGDHDDTNSNDSDEEHSNSSLTVLEPTKETKEELSELVNIKKVRSNITHFTKLSSNIEEKLDWTLLPFTLTPARASHSVAVYGVTIVTIGGEGISGVDQLIQFSDVDKGISTTPKVTGGKAGPESISQHDTCRIGNKFYLFGGICSGKMSNKVFVLSIIDDCTVHWSQPRINSYSPSPRIGHTFTRYGNKFILFGGFDGQNILNDIHILDPETMTWSNLSVTGTPPSERYGHSTTILGEKLIVFGGSNRVKDLNDINILQLDSYCWTQPPVQGSELPPERSFHAATRVGRNLIVVGGKKEGVCHRDVWILSYRLHWTKVTGVQITPHSHHALIKNGSNLCILGGKGQNGNLLDDVWIVNTTNLPITSSVTMINYSDIKIDKEIGKGHFSKVLRGMWKGKDVAVKKLNLIKDKGKEEMMNEFKAEVELLGTLQHPNLVNCYGYCIQPMCIVMEFLPTGNLFDMIHSREQTNKLDSALMLQFAYDIARGMEHLHSRNIIHRDLKSSNLLLDKHFNVKIADLGIARETSFTQTMTTIGTVAWTAPEILRHESYNQKADVYSYGIVLWELLTGEEPYDGIPPMNAGILVASKELRPEIPDNCDPNWKRLVVWCWTEDPNKRPTFTEILKYLTNTF